MLKFIHVADFHLDSAFAALPPGRALGPGAFKGAGGGGGSGAAY